MYIVQDCHVARLNCLRSGSNIRTSAVYCGNLVDLDTVDFSDLTQFIAVKVRVLPFPRVALLCSSLRPQCATLQHNCCCCACVSVVFMFWLEAYILFLFLHLITEARMLCGFSYAVVSHCYHHCPRAPYAFDSAQRGSGMLRTQHFSCIAGSVCDYCNCSFYTQASRSQTWAQLGPSIAEVLGLPQSELRCVAMVFVLPVRMCSFLLLCSRALYGLVRARASH